MNLIDLGKQKKLIAFDRDEKTITYIHPKKKRNYANPEEKVQAQAYLSLVLDYSYPPEQINIFENVTMGRAVKEADIIVYGDDECLSPHIVVECKKPDVSELEFAHAVDQAFSYAVSIGAKFVWVTSDLKNEYYEVSDKRPKARTTISDIPQFGISKLAQFKYAKGGGKQDGQKLFDLEIVTEDELTRRFKQAHQALWGGGELNPSEAFDELDKLIFCKLRDEKKPRKRGEPYDFQIFVEDTEEKTADELLKRIKALYEEGRKIDPEVFKDDVRLSANKVRTVVSYLESVNLGDTDLDSKGRAFETFMGSFFRGDFGQFFTPRAIVKFIVDSLPIDNESLVLDTSCGSGGFLLHALDKVRRQADEAWSEQIPDHTANKPEGKDHYNYWHTFAERNLYGIEINEQIARTAKMNMIIHDDGHTNVVTTDGLLNDKDIQTRTNNKNFRYGRFDFIITNPPFGSTVRLTERAYMKNYGLATREIDWLNPKSQKGFRDSQSTEVLFIEQCHRFLADDGYLAIVIPDSILTNSSLQYVRDSIEEMYRIVAIVSLPQTAFTATGAGVKSSVLFLRKHTQETTDRIGAQKKEFQEYLKKQHSFPETLDDLEKEKEEKIKNAIGFGNPDRLNGKKLKESQAFKQWKQQISDEYDERIEKFKEQLEEEYLHLRQKKLDEYSIFMAVAQDIGYDATGKPTGKNDLDRISTELARFIESIEKGKA